MVERNTCDGCRLPGGGTDSSKADLPKVGGFDLWGAGFAVDDLSAEDDLQVFLVACGAGDTFELGEVVGVGEELACGDGAATSYAGGDDGDASSDVVGEAGEDSVVTIYIGGHLLGAVYGPVGLGGSVAVDDAQPGHAGFVGEVIAEIFGEPEGPGVVECTDEDGGTVAKVGEAGYVFAAQGVVFSVGLENAGHADDGAEVVDDDGGEVVGEGDLTGGVGGIAQGDDGVLALVCDAEEDRVTTFEDGAPEEIEWGAAVCVPEEGCGGGCDGECSTEGEEGGAPGFAVRGDGRVGRDGLGGVRFMGDGLRGVVGLLFLAGLDGCWAGGGPVELRDVGTGEKGDAEFVLVAGVLVVLGDALADLGCRDANDGVGGGVVVGVLAEDLNAEGSLFEGVRLAGDGVVNDEAEEGGKATAVTEVRIGEQALHLEMDGAPFFFGEVSGSVCYRVK